MLVKNKFTYGTKISEMRNAFSGITVILELRTGCRETGTAAHNNDFQFEDAEKVVVLKAMGGIVEEEEGEVGKRKRTSPPRRVVLVACWLAAWAGPTYILSIYREKKGVS